MTIRPQPAEKTKESQIIQNCGVRTHWPWVRSATLPSAAPPLAVGGCPAGGLPAGGRIREQQGAEHDGHQENDAEHKISAIDAVRGDKICPGAAELDENEGAGAEARHGQAR